MPTLADFDAAMLQPGRSVPAIKRLGGGTIVMAGPEQPWRVVGLNAVVYQLSQPSGGALALRCPLGQPGLLDPVLGDRYRSLASDPAVAPLRRSGGPLVGGLVFFPEGLILPAGEFRSVGHPIMVMEWVKGPTLLAAVDRACREDDAPTLAALADTWAAAVTRLAQASFSHGDLVADNAMIRPSGGIALIDYDTCSWPDGPAPRRPAGSRAASGPPPGYAHPSGEAPPLAQRDDYPALVIYTSLQALSRWPRLRQQFGDPPSRTGGALLFAAADLAQPERSPLVRALRDLDDPVVSRLMSTLLRAGAGSVRDVPPLYEVVAEARMVSARAGLDRSRSRASWQPERLSTRSEPAPPPRWDDLAPTEVLPRVEPEDRGLPPWSGSRAAAAAERPELADALDRQRKLTQLNSLLLAGDEAAAERFWRESGLAADRDAVRELGTRIGDIRRRRLLAEARSAVEAGDAGAFVRSWDEGGLDQYQPAASLRPLVESARRRTNGAEHLRAALDVKDVAAVTRLWPELRHDPRAAAYAVRVHGLVAEHARAAIVAAIRRGDDDALLVAVREAEGAGVAVDQAARRAALAARERLETRHALRAAIAVNDRTTLASLALSGRLAELGPIELAVSRTVKQAVAWPHLERALIADDDDEIRTTYDAALFDDAGALTPEQRARVDLARYRLGWLAQVRTAIKRRDPATLRSALGKPPPGAEARLTRVERARIIRLTTAEPT